MALHEHESTQSQQVSPTAQTIPSLNGRSWPPTQPTFRRREIFPLGLTIVLTTLALLLILAGFGFVIYSTAIQYRSSIHAQAARLTAATQTTARPQIPTPSGELATAQAQIDATATAQSEATATTTAVIIQATATATALQDMYAKITSGTPRLQDPLSDNTANNQWDEGSDGAKSACIFKDSNYHVIEAQLDFLQPCFAETTSFSNFAYQVQMNITRGSEGGILFRANRAKGQYYLFRIDTKGTYAFEIYNNNQFATLSSGRTPAISPGLKQANQIAVIAKQSTFYLYINQQYVASATNNAFSSGQIGLAALDYSTPTEVEFSNVQVWKL